MYTLHRDSELNDSAKPRKFANARYRAVHREFDTIRKAPSFSVFQKDIDWSSKLCYRISETMTATVKSMGLRMEVNINDFQCNCHYIFAVRAISIHNGIGPFCAPVKIFTGNTLVDHR
ncbi:unnamed protein product [Rotaria sordida]|uniref:Activating transcription factor 7-interacting protein Fn3 domain-containing protein n=1 Tax=Rotaria sordida TaxID=392033 RepID=A0A819IAQ1_9BILA|nr:unnamed protein product [Rotaria sordida]CAF3909982.1 unnamed protein product [Rotaria sordida]